MRPHFYKILSVFVIALGLFSLLPSSSILMVRADGDTVNISPVVQLVSYKNIYGKYVEMYGWGSASIISNDGVILSNNHVVDNGKGKLASAFNVCVTKKIGEKPSCDYTATLISRDDTMDVSLLKIDPTDIFGNAVDYAKFKTIDIDFSYNPQTQDEAVIIGYPWIGSETITETKGIVSGISEFNGYKYIKTDATIAGGNSGGAMINKAGKLIGIPTYTVGWESSLGYGLYLKEAQKFINDNIHTAVTPKKTGFNFSEYQKTLENINQADKVEDDLLKFSFGKDYEVKNYIKNRYLDFNTKTQKDVSVGINMELISLPNLTQDKHFWYYVQNLGLYNKDWQNLNQRKIGGVNFYSPVGKSDVSQGNADYVTLYFTKLSPNLMLKMEVYAPLYDEKNNAKVKKETDSVLSGFTFKTDKIKLLESGFTFDLLSPVVKINTSELSSKNDRYGYYINYLHNLHEYFTVNLQEQDLWSGKGKTAEEIYKIETLDASSDYKSMITFMGHKGYVICEGYGGGYYGGKGGFYGPVYSYYGNYYYQYGGYGSGKDENDVTLPAMTNCTIKLLDGISDLEGQDYFLIISLNAAVYNIKESLQETLDFMSKNMKLDPKGNGETKLVNVYNQQAALSFTDVENQNEAYKSFLKVLIKYGLLKNKEKFNGDYAMTWKDVLPIYLKAIYNVDLAKDAPACKDNKACMIKTAKSMLAGQTIDWNDLLIKKMKINLDAYVPSEKLYYFERILHYRLAGVNLPVFSEKEITNFENKRMEKKYKAEADKLDTFDSLVYGKRKINLYEVMPSGYSYYQSDYTVNWSPSRGIQMDPVYKTEPYNFNPAKTVNDLNYYSDSAKKAKSKEEKVKNDFDACMKTGKIQTCVQNYVIEFAKIMKEQEDEAFSFGVLTKAALYDNVAQDIDFGLFDPELAKKKDSQINESGDMTNTTEPAPMETPAPPTEVPPMK